MYDFFACLLRHASDSSRSRGVVIGMRSSSIATASDGCFRRRELVGCRRQTEGGRVCARVRFTAIGSGILDLVTLLALFKSRWERFGDQGLKSLVGSLRQGCSGWAVKHQLPPLQGIPHPAPAWSP